MLASDLNNPEFQGAINPDETLFVEFYYHEPIDKWASEEAGKLVKQKEMKYDEASKTFKPTGKDARVVYVRIMSPAVKESIIERPALDMHKVRFPKQWMQFQIREGMESGQADVPGWKIEDWPELSEDQRRELKYQRFYTVELIAGANDAQLQRMGMDGFAMRERARIALKAKNMEGVKAEMEAKDKMIADLAARLTALENVGKPKPMGLPRG